MAEKHTDDGGFAFPCAADENSGWSATYGMSLRDWFAGQTLAGMIAATGREASRDEVEEITEAKVRSAYRYADAMLVERSK